MMERNQMHSENPQAMEHVRTGVGRLLALGMIAAAFIVLNLPWPNPWPRAALSSVYPPRMLSLVLLAAAGLLIDALRSPDARVRLVRGVPPIAFLLWLLSTVAVLLLFVPSAFEAAYGGQQRPSWGAVLAAWSEGSSWVLAVLAYFVGFYLVVLAAYLGARRLGMSDDRWDALMHLRFREGSANRKT
jgi:hypothetical protein